MEGILVKREKTKWYDLDNVAKIFPPSSNKKDPRVFRFTCELTEEIDPSCLEKAAYEALRLFPYFRVVLKKGFFWYYLESTHLLPTVKEEKIPVCSPIYRKSSRKLLFRISYYHKRINLEVYHALADGNGALQYLETIVAYYLTYRYEEEYKNIPVELSYDASTSEKTDDSFQKYYRKSKKNKPIKEKKSYQFTGEKIKTGRIKVVEGRMPVKEALNKAHTYKTTLTGYITAVYIYAIGKNMKESEREKPIHIMVPVNLRTFFESASARNFFCMVPVRYTFKKKDTSFTDIVKSVTKSLQKELQTKNIEARMNEYVRLEKNFMARVVPLVLKNIVLKIAAATESKNITSVVTNLGKVTMPEIYKKHIRLFDVFVSTSKMQISMISYGDTLSISFTSSFIEGEVIKDFYRFLAGEGIAITVATNKVEG